MRATLGFGMVALAVLSVSPAVRADARPFKVGLQLNVAKDMDFGAGGRVVWSLAQYQPGLELIGSFDVFFPGDFNYYEINANLTYTFNLQGSRIAPYAGAGLNVARWLSDTHGGVNLLGGLKFSTGGVITPFAEIRGEVNGGKQAIVTGGILF